MTDLAPLSTPDIAPAPSPVSSNLPSLDIASAAQVAGFGEDAQRELAGFAERMLAETKNRDLGDAGALLTDLIVKVKGLDPSQLEKSGAVSRLFGGLRRALARFRGKFETLSAQVDGIAAELDERVHQMRTDMALLDGLHADARASIGRLDAYVEVGKSQAARFRQEVLPALQARAGRPGGDSTADLMAAQDHHDALQQLDRLEKRVAILQQARQIAIQQLPQIRVVQNGDAMLAESLAASITLTIPAWKSQMAMLLGLARQREALGLQQAVTEATNQLLLQSADTIKSQSLAIEQQAQRGLVDAEVMSKTNQNLIDTLNGVLDLQSEGRRKRAALESELAGQTAALREALAQPER